MDHAVIKQEGSVVQTIGRVPPRIPTVALDDSWFKRMVDDRLYNLDPDFATLEIDAFCNKNFNVDDEIGDSSFSPTGVPYVTYAIGTQVSREILEDFRNDDIDIISGCRVYLIYCLKETLQIIRNEYDENPGLFWRMKPITKVVAGDALMDCETIIAAMRIHIEPAN